MDIDKAKPRPWRTKPIHNRLRPTSDLWIDDATGTPVLLCAPDTAAIIIQAVNAYEHMLEALTKVAAFDDKAASDLADITGSYSAFDEPGSVKIARDTLAKIKPETAERTE